MDEPKGGALPAQQQDQAAPEPTPEAREAFDVVVGRTLEALAQDPEGLDAALKADPVAGAVAYGTKALHGIAAAADEAGSPIPFEILSGAGMQVIKVMGGIANDKGYLPDEQIEVFLKEAFQQSLAKYTAMDMQAGKIDQRTVEQVRQVMGGQAPQPASPPAPGGALAAAGGA
jgi:hypothetical protein